MRENLIKVKDGIVSIAKTITWLGNVLTSNWKWLIGGVLLSPLLGMVSWGFSQVLAYQQRNAIGGPGAPASGGLGSIAAGKLLRGEYAAGRSMGMSRTSSAAEALKSTWGASKGFRSAVKGGGALTAIMAGYGIYDAISSYNDREKEIRENTELSEIEKQHEMKRAAKERNSQLAGVGGGVAGSIIGGAIGTAIAPGLGTAIGAALGGWLGDMGGKALGDAVQGDEELHHDRVSIAGDGGTRGARSKNTPLKSNEVSAILERGEVVVSLDAVNTLYTRMQALQESVLALPVGNKEYFYTNASQSSQNTGNNQITVNDINVKFSGSIRLEGGSGYRDYDINDLVENKEFVRRLFSRPEVIDAIRYSFNTNVNLGLNRDPLASNGGLPSTLYGKLSNA
jgi:hypothetical protein